MSGPEFGLALGAMRRFAAGALEALAPYDAVLTPTLAAPPLPVGAIRNDADPAADFEAQKAFTPVDLGLERHRHAGRLAAAALDRRTACRSGVMLAARPAEEELLLSLSRADRGGRALGRPEAAGMVTRPADHRAHRRARPREELTAIRALLDDAFETTSATTTGSTRSAAPMRSSSTRDDAVVAHGSLVMRRLLA